MWFGGRLILPNTSQALQVATARKAELEELLAKMRAGARSGDSIANRLQVRPRLLTLITGIQYLA